MTTVALSVSGLQRDIDTVWPLMGEISQAFQPLSITLAPELGRVLAQDPEATGGWSTLIGQLEAGSNFSTPAHLVVSDWAPCSDPTINGMLCDAEVRGVSAVYMNAAIYGPQGPEARGDLVVQVCVHELGHLLNLTHTDGGDVAYSNTMLQAYQRQSQSAVEAWQAAANFDLEHGYQTVPTPNPIHCYPFSPQSRANLRAASVDESWLPFKSRFRDDQSAGGVDDRTLDIQITPHGEPSATHVGGELYFTLTAENGQNHPIDAPLHIGPEHGSLRITVEHEDGRRTLHRPFQIYCSEARQTLLPGQRLSQSVALTSSRSSRLIESAGRHLCHVELIDSQGPKRARLGAASFAFEAREDAAAAEASASLVKLLTPGSPRPRRLPAIDAIDPVSSLANHIRVAYALRRRPDRTRRALLAHCEAPGAPLALRHLAARHAAVDRMRRGEDWRALEAEVRQRFPGEADLVLIHALRRSADGWARRVRQEPLR
jgi:hypothetical protein